MNCVRASNGNGVIASLGSQLIIEKGNSKIVSVFKLSSYFRHLQPSQYCLPSSGASFDKSLLVDLRYQVVSWPTAASKERKLQLVVLEKGWYLPADHGKDPLGPSYRY